MIEIKKDLYWVGIKDWELKKFHGEEFATEQGSSYNAYIVKGTEKTVLVDTCWGPFKEEFVKHLEATIGLDNIDALICQHSESDHSGAMVTLLDKLPDLPVYCTNKCKQMLTAQYHKDWNFITVKTGETLDLGGYELTFIEAPMLHWPDSMFTYIKGMDVLLSNDAFGQHYVSSSLYADEVDQCILWQEAIKYYANIITPYSKMVRTKIDQIKKMNVPLEMICTSHGLIWRKDPMQIVEKYYEWAGPYKENQVAIIYDTMWGETKAMAEALGRGVTKGGMTAKVINVSKIEVTHVLTEVFRSAGILAGSPTINNGISHAMAAVMEGIRHLKFQGKKGAGFGSYGWSGESAATLHNMLQQAGIEPVGEPLKAMHMPYEKDILELEAFGEAFAKQLQ